MQDVQSRRDHRCIDIRKVGVKAVNYPVRVLDQTHQVQDTVAAVDMYVDLPHRFKGTHMSRFLEILNKVHGCIDPSGLQAILEEMKQRLEAETAHLELRFPYFLAQEGGGPPWLRRYECRMHALRDGRDDLLLEVEVPISAPVDDGEERGHLPRSPGRWGTARVQVRFRRFLWLETIISLVSEGIEHSIRGREAMRVETVCDRLATRLAGQRALSWFRVEVENLAAGYTTFAVIERSLDHAGQRPGRTPSRRTRPCGETMD